MTLETVVECPYTDALTRNLVLQRMGSDAVEANEFGFGFESEEREIPIMVEEKTPAFLYSAEFYKKIADDKKRRAAYRAIEISNVPNQEEQDIKTNPFKYLGVSATATFELVRAAYISLSKVYHPDIVHPSNRRQRDLIFGKENVILETGDSLDVLLKSLEGKAPPVVLREKAIAELSIEERAKYMAEHEVYRQLEMKYEALKREMQARATKKMQLISKAYSAAKELFAESGTSLGGFSWEKVVVYSPITALMGEHFQHERLSLEGQGEIRKDVGRLATNNDVYLGYDYGEPYMMDADYLQRLPLKSFFAWTEIIQERELSPQLLESVVAHYKFNPDKAEQLRVMLMNQESADFIVKTLDISEPQGYEGNQLRWFVDYAVHGPTFMIQKGPRDCKYYPLGVEFTPLGGLILNYRTQQSQHDWWGEPQENSVHFTPTDVKLMMSQAYGPMLE